MAIAVVATLIGPGSGALGPHVADPDRAGAAVGYQLATRVQMTQMPELVAIMHSLVGLAAVFVGFNADIEIGRVAAEFMEAGLPFPQPEGPLSEAAYTLLGTLSNFGELIAKKTGVEIGILRVELVLGIWIGAVTFTGSVVAYGKLSGNSSLLPFKIDTAAKQLPGRAYAERGRGGGLGLPADPLHGRVGHLGAGAAGASGLLHRLSPDHGDRRRGHARGRLDAEQLLGLGGRSDRLLARQRPPDRGRRARGLLGCDPQLHHVQGHEPELHLRHPRRLSAAQAASRWRSRASRSPSTPTAWPMR
jgi:hypothetical protein